MSKAKIRKERTLSVSNIALTVEQMAALSSLFVDNRYETLLDVFERACIEQDTALINTPAEEESTVLALHKLSKAYWNVFVYVQAQVKLAHDTMTRPEDDEEEPELPAEEDEIQGV